jgi:hypothetical protein
MATATPCMDQLTACTPLQSLLEKLLCITLEEHWSRWREALGSILKMCIMLSRGH